jgi:GntR family transcriptional regulator of arabinose operon
MIRSMAGNGSRLTKYEIVRAHILELIENGSVRVGDNLPGEMELAEELGVSRNTVRHAFSELVQRGIVERTRRKGTVYIGESSGPDAPRTIGIVSSWLTYNIYPELIHGLEDGLYRGGYSMILANGNSDREKERESVSRMLDQGIAGLIIEPSLSASLDESDPLVRTLNELDIPILLTNNLISGLRASAITIDDFRIGEDATRYLIEMGHTRIACVYKADTRSGVLRYDGYRSALEAAGIGCDEALVRSYNDIAEERRPGAVLTRQVMESATKRPTAFFYFNDEMAMQGYDYFASTGISIPDDISIVGVDNIRESSLVSPPLTTFNHPKYVMGKIAAELMLARLGSHTYHSEYVVTMRLELVERGSVADLTSTSGAGAGE